MNTDITPALIQLQGGCSGVVVEYRTRNREVAGSTYTQSTAVYGTRFLVSLFGADFYSMCVIGINSQRYITVRKRSLAGDCVKLAVCTLQLGIAIPDPFSQSRDAELRNV